MLCREVPETDEKTRHMEVKKMKSFFLDFRFCDFLSGVGNFTPPERR